MVEKRIVIARKTFVFFLGFLIWKTVAAIRSVKVMIPIMLLLIPMVWLYSEFWTTEHDEVSSPQSSLIGVKARRIEKAREIVKRVRSILYFMFLLRWFCIKRLW